MSFGLCNRFNFIYFMISIESMIINNVHLGHSIKKVNKRMIPFIYGEKNGLHIIDLLQTLLFLHRVCRFIYKSTIDNRNFELT